MRTIERFTAALPGFAAVSFLSLSSACTWLGPVSMNSANEQSNGHSRYLSRLSDDGRYIAFSSEGDNLVAGDDNGVSDVFVRDVLNESTIRVSVASGGGQANGRSYLTDISPDGRYVVFFSEADNLVGGDGNGAWDVFLHDIQGMTTERVSLGNAGAEGDGDSTRAFVSADGRYVAFESDAANLVTDDDNARRDVFVRDRTGSTTTMVSVDSQGSAGNEGSYVCDLTADGRHVGFHSFADNLVQAPATERWVRNVYLHDRDTGTTAIASTDISGLASTSGSYGCSLTADAQLVAFESADVFFAGDKERIQDIYVKDMLSGVLEKVSEGEGGLPATADSFQPMLSPDGRYVSFQSVASNLTADPYSGGVHVYVRDRQNAATMRLSKTGGNAPVSGRSSLPAVSANGRYVSFLTDSDQLFANDNNAADDILVRAVHTLTVDAIVPDQLPIGATTTVTLHGSNFLAGTVPAVNGGNVSNVVIVDESTITLDVTVPGTTEVGSQDVLALLFAPYGPPGEVIKGSSAICSGCVTYF